MTDITGKKKRISGGSTTNEYFRCTLKAAMNIER